MNEFLSSIHLNLSDVTLLLIALTIIELFIIFLLLRKTYKKHHLSSDKITETITDANTRGKTTRIYEFIESYGKEKTDVKISTEAVSGVPIQHAKIIDSKVTETIIAADAQRKPSHSLPEWLSELLKDLDSTDSTEHIDQGKLDELDKFLHQEIYPLITEAGLFEHAYDICEEIDKAHRQWRSILLKPWIKDKTTIAFMGKFSSGKSSIINSLLGDKLLPVGVTPTTNVSAYISFGLKFAIKAVDNDGNIKNIRREIFNLLTKDVLGDFSVARLIKYFVIEYKNDSLKDKSILDTPGYNSLDEKDKLKALQVIKESDAVFWVVDINDGEITKDALNFIKDNLKNKPLFLLLNKAETKSSGEQKKVLAKVTATLKKADIKFESCELYSNRDRAYIEQLIFVLSTMQSNDVNNHKENIIKRIDSIINGVNAAAAAYSKEHIEYVKLKDEAENNKGKIPKDVDKELDKIYSAVFGTIRGSHNPFSSSKVIVPEKWDAFVAGLDKAMEYGTQKYYELGSEVMRAEWLEDLVKKSEESLTQKKALRTEAHKVKAKAKNIFEEVL